MYNHKILFLVSGGNLKVNINNWNKLNKMKIWNKSSLVNLNAFQRKKLSIEKEYIERLMNWYTYIDKPTKKKNCPMNCASLKESLVYYATISCNVKNYKPKLYKGSCQTSFKKRYSNRKKSFNVPLYKHDTKL